MLTLVNLCILAIRNYIERNVIHHVHQLPPRWHQIILDYILKHGTILRKSCIQALSTIEFISPLSTLSTISGRVNDDAYLDQLANTLRNIKNQDQLKLRRLVLNLYAIGETENGKHQASIQNLHNISGLISKCPNLKVLHFSFLLTDENGSPGPPHNANILRFLPLSSSTSPSTWRALEDGGFLNVIDIYRSCLKVLENLTEFSFMVAETRERRQPPLLTSHRPPIAFKKLTCLRLIGGTAYFDAWFRFLTGVSSTLQYLHVENVEFHWGRERNACVLPIGMANLISLGAHGPLSYCDSILVRNLKKCNRLQLVSLTLSGLEMEENWISLSEMEAVQDIKLNFRHGVFSERGVDEIIKKLVDLFGNKITSFMFNGTRTTAFYSACQILAKTCTNLVSLRLDTTATFIENDQHFLLPIFADKRRAFQLRDLELHGRLGQSVLTALVENCRNVELLTIHDCPQLTDDHLRRLVDHGAQPRSLKLVNCPKVADDGLQWFLINTGLRLTHFQCISIIFDQNISKKTLDILAENCRNVEWLCLPKSSCNDDSLTNIRNKSFKCPMKTVLT